MVESTTITPDLTVQEAARQLGTHPETVRRWLRKGLLPHAYKTPSGYGWRIPAADLDALRSKGPRPLPRTVGIVADGSLPARDAEEYLRRHWPTE